MAEPSGHILAISTKHSADLVAKWRYLRALERLRAKHLRVKPRTTGVLADRAFQNLIMAHERWLTQRGVDWRAKLNVPTFDRASNPRQAAEANAVIFDRNNPDGRRKDPNDGYKGPPPAIRPVVSTYRPG